MGKADEGSSLGDRIRFSIGCASWSARTSMQEHIEVQQRHSNVDSLEIGVASFTRVERCSIAIERRRLRHAAQFSTTCSVNFDGVSRVVSMLVIIEVEMLG